MRTVEEIGNHDFKAIETLPGAGGFWTLYKCKRCNEEFTHFTKMDGW